MLFSYSASLRLGVSELSFELRGKARRFRQVNAETQRRGDTEKPDAMIPDGFSAPLYRCRSPVEFVNVIAG